MTLHRRALLQAGQAGLAAAAWARTGSARDCAHSAQNTLVMGWIGCGGQGTSLLKRFLSLADVQVAHVCDPDEHRRKAAADVVGQSGRSHPADTADLRRILDDASVDAVVIATPDHWHAPSGILACAAGKHVYVEKPCAHNLREGRLLVQAARTHQRLVQHGTHSRSMPLITHAIGALHQGLIGDVLVARAFNVQKRNPIGKAQPSDPPPELDYDTWVGPAPAVPFQANRYHYNWHWWYAFGTGDTGNDGVHELDIARWGLGMHTHPSNIMAVGGKNFFDDDQEFPDTQNVVFEYPPEQDASPPRRKQLVFEMRIWSPYSPDEGIDNGVAFYGTQGWMLLSKRGVARAFGPRNTPLPIPGTPADQPGHHENFVNAIRQGEPLTAEIEVGHLSSALCHLANIATRRGRSLRFAADTESIPDDRQAQAMLSRTYRDSHWAKPAGV